MWIVYRAAVHGFGRRVETELGRLGGGDDDESRPSIARDELGVGRRDAIGKQARTVCIDHPGDRGPEVFHDEGNAGQRPFGYTGGHFRECGLGANLRNRVDVGIPLVDQLQRVLDRFACRQLAGADGCGESGGIELFQAIVDAAEYVTTKPTLVASAATLFFIIRVFENMQRRRGVDAEPDVLETDEVVLLEEIRDLLRERA